MDQSPLVGLTMLLTVLFTEARRRNSPSAHQQANEKQNVVESHYRAPFGPRPKEVKFMEAGRRIVTVGTGKGLSGGVASCV